MILSRRAALDGAQLDAVDKRILIQGIETQAGKDTIGTANPGGTDGLRVTARKRDSLDILIRFSINEKSYRPAEREAVFQKAMSWAATGGWLTVNYKSGQKIRVVPAQYPGEGDILNRENSYNITFRAHGVPFWQEADPEPVTMTGASGSGTISVAGNQKTFLEFSFENTGSGTINTLTISCAGTQYQFAGLGLAAGETLICDHLDDGTKCLQRIRILNGSTYRSAMAKRSGSDELMAMPGENTVSYTAGGAGILTLTAAGRYA